MSTSAPSNVDPRVGLVLSDGEVDFFWWFIQGSLMDADVRARLYGHWGLCQRHALAFFIVESAFRPHSLHGCTILYADLMRRALRHLMRVFTAWFRTAWRCTSCVNLDLAMSALSAMAPSLPEVRRRSNECSPLGAFGCGRSPGCGRETQST